MSNQKLNLEGLAISQDLVLNKHIGKENSQILLEGDYIIPDTKPDIADILRPKAELMMHKIESLTNRVSFSGKLNIDMLYNVKGTQGEISGLSINVSVDDFINIEGVMPNMWSFLNYSIAHMEYRIINDRKIGYRAIIDIAASIIDNTSARFVTHIEELASTQQKTTSFAINQIIELKRDEFPIKEEITLPPNKPAIANLLESSLSINNKEIKALGGRVNISGDLLVSLLYKGHDEGALIELSDFELPFSGSIDIELSKDTSFADCNLVIKDSILQVVQNDDGEPRILQIEANILAEIKLSAVIDLQTLEDAYCIDQKLNITQEFVQYSHLVSRNKNQFNVKEAVFLEDAPEIMQILKASGKVLLEDKKVVEDKVIAEGIVTADILYISSSDLQPLYNYSAVVPFKQVIETRGSDISMNCEINANLDHISINMLSSSEVELRFLLSFTTEVIQAKQIGLITDIEFSPMNKEEIDELPSMAVITIGKNDSLWSIAKKYNASLEELAAINDISNPDDIKQGQKLLVVKKAI